MRRMNDLAGWLVDCLRIVWHNVHTNYCVNLFSCFLIVRSAFFSAVCHPSDGMGDTFAASLERPGGSLA